MSFCPHAQALGGQLCIILAQSLSPSRLFIASLTVSLWALSTLRWTPTLRQASILVRLLTQAAASGGLDMKHACVLLYSLGRLRLRLPAPVLQYLMSNMAAGMAGASMADLLQVRAIITLWGWEGGGRGRGCKRHRVLPRLGFHPCAAAEAGSLCAAWGGGAACVCTAVAICRAAAAACTSTAVLDD